MYTHEIFDSVGPIENSQSILDVGMCSYPWGAMYFSFWSIASITYSSPPPSHPKGLESRLVLTIYPIVRTYFKHHRDMMMSHYIPHHHSSFIFISSSTIRIRPRDHHGRRRHGRPPLPPSSKPSPPSPSPLQSLPGRRRHAITIASAISSRAPPSPVPAAVTKTKAVLPQQCGRLAVPCNRSGTEA